jgi:hypothetical protein
MAALLFGKEGLPEGRDVLGPLHQDQQLLLHAFT